MGQNRLDKARSDEEASGATIRHSGRGFGGGVGEMVMTAHPLAHLATLSPSKLSTWDWCLACFRDRYLYRIEEPPNIDLAFGRAVHKGLEVHYGGEDHELGFLRAWRDETAVLKAAGVAVPNLTSRGLELVESVVSLGLAGLAEHRITLFLAELPVPIVGIVDFYDPLAHWVLDWKTSAWRWPLSKLAYQRYQPGVYSQAIMEEVEADTLPGFEFIVLPKAQQPMQRLDASQSSRQVVETFERIREVYAAMCVEQTYAPSKHCTRHEAAA